MLGWTSASFRLLAGSTAWRSLEKPDAMAMTTAKAGRMISRKVNQRFAGDWIMAMAAPITETENQVTRNETPYTPV